MNKYFILILFLYLLPYLFYRSVSHGLGHKAEYLQMRRFLPCAILAVLPIYLANISLSEPLFLTSFVIGLSWIVTYPLFYFFTYRKNSSDFGFHFDIVFGLYIIAWLTSLKILVITFNLLPFFFLSLIISYMCSINTLFTFIFFSMLESISCSLLFNVCSYRFLILIFAVKVLLSFP